MFVAECDNVDRHLVRVLGHFWPGMLANAGVFVVGIQNPRQPSGADSASGKSRCVKTGVPMRVAEQRRSDRSMARGLSEGEHRLSLLRLHPFEPEFRSGLSLRVAQGTPQGRLTWGRLSLLTFFGEAKKVSCRRQPRHRKTID